MGDSVKYTRDIWMFGKRYTWTAYQSNLALHPHEFDHNGTTVVRHQKNQICIHWTAGNGTATGVISGWNKKATDFLAGLLEENKSFASAHYIVELAYARLTASQPYVDITEVVDSDTVTWHGGPINNTAIGIETTNVGWNWTDATHDTFVGTQAAKRPTDTNHFLHLVDPHIPRSNMGSHHDFQYFQEEQYLGFLLLIRALCIKHRIPRRFLGETTNEKLQRWWDDLGSDSQFIRSSLRRFRGILSHMNCSGPPASKECGGPALHRNRLFRGIIDEWWPPVQLDGSERPYYMGPFDPQASQPSYFRWSQGALQSQLFHDANLDCLQETKSYFDFDWVPLYYAHTEDAFRGGSFPIGTNRIWHGGVHFEPPEANRKVYAAASGTIVAARLGGNIQVEQKAEYGSQRFVLIRHCVYTEQEADPGGGTRTNYTAAPKFFFTLYMHLAPFLPAIDNNNPPWFNYWLRHRTAAADTNGVFYPNIPVPPGEFSGVPVSVGDWIGSCGTFRTRPLLHFELMSREELTVDPWNDPNLRVVDGDQNLLCDSPAIRNFIRSRTGQNIDEVDIIRASAQLRNVKSFHKSEWALSGPDSLIGLLPNPNQRQQKWNDLRFFMWVPEAVAACPDLATQLCDAQGMMWHYHPVTFMKFVNQLVLRENGQVNEPDMSNVNVFMQDDFLTRFVHKVGNVFQDVAADQERLQPFDIPPSNVAANDFRYHFTRADVACRVTGAHNPGPTPATSTHFHISLLDILESTRIIFNQSVNVALSFVCNGHNIPANSGLCVTNTLTPHNQGIACDLRPANATPTSCKALWDAAQKSITSYNVSCSAHAGEPSRPDLGDFLSAFRRTVPTLQTKLDANQALTSQEAHSFVMHIELVVQSVTVLWQSFLRKPTVAIAARIQGGGIVGSYASQAQAAHETAFPHSVVQHGANWDCWLRFPSHAVAVQLRPASGTGGVASIVATYPNVELAEAEKGADFAWPIQGP